MSSILQNDFYSNSAIKQPSRPFHHRLIMRDYRQIKPPLAQWSMNLRELIQQPDLKAGNPMQAREVSMSDWFWQAADILIFAGFFREARDVCYAHIQLMLNLSQSRNQNDCLWYAFKSWVNLARVDRLSKQYAAASKKLQAHQHWRGRVLQHAEDCSNLVSVAMERVRREYNIEKIKLYFSMHQVHRIINEFSVVQQAVHYDHGFTIDALILAYVQAGYIHEALHLAERMQTVKSVSEFAFMRTQEIKWSYFHEKIDTQAMLHLNHAMLQGVNADDANLPNLILSLHLARLLYHARLNECAETLLTSCLDQVIQLGDDVLKAEILAMLFSNGVRYYAGDLLEDYLVSHYHVTQYPAARAILLRALPGLKHVEINQDFHQLTMLAHDFLLLSSAYI